MWLRKFELLRDQAGEGGGAGGSSDVSGPSEREIALEGRLNKMQQTLHTMQQTSQTQAQQSEAAQLTARVEMAVTDAENAVNTAETALASALEEGDNVAIAKAQRLLADASSGAERKRADRDSFKAEMQRNERRAGGTRAESGTGTMDTSNLDQWKTSHKEWYGVDAEMTRVSHEIDAGIRQAGTYTVGSKDYFAAIDRALKTRFPDRFSGAPASAAARGEAPGGGSSTPRRYDREVQRSMEAFGLTAEQWDGARSVAVKKGFLNETPTRGRALG